MDFIIAQSKGTCCLTNDTLTLHVSNYACVGSTTYTLTQTAADTWTGSGQSWCSGQSVNFTFTCTGGNYGTLLESCVNGDTSYSQSINCSGPTFWGPTTTGTFTNCVDTGGTDYWITA